MRPRIERCLSARGGYARGWIVLWGEGVREYCLHDTLGEAIDCAVDRVRSRALAMEGGW